MENLMKKLKNHFSIKSVLSLSIFLSVFFSFQINAESVDELIKQGDKFTEQFQNQKALDTYLKAEKSAPENWEVLWRISRAYVDVAEKLQSKEEQEKLYQKSLDYAERSVKLAPNESVTYLRRAISTGRIALFKGVFSAVGLVKDVKRDAEKAIQLGNGGNYVQALSHYILGRTHAKVCEKGKLIRAPLGLGWGNMETAISELNKAIQLYPDFRMFYLELGKAYLREDEDKKAKETLSKIEKIPVAHFEDGKVLAEAKELLKKI